MKSKLISDRPGEKTYVLIFDKGDEVISTLTSFAKENKLAESHLTAIGAFSILTLGYFDRERRDYNRIPLNEQVEVLSLVGDIAINDKDNSPMLHAHVVVGKSDGTAWGGHILEAKVWPTLEVVIVESPRHLHRQLDPETGLALIKL